MEDQGRGIPADLLPHVFELFTQAEVHNGAAGLGLGLSIVKDYVELHGGTVQVRSEGARRVIVRRPLSGSPEKARTENGCRANRYNCCRRELGRRVVACFGHEHTFAKRMSRRSQPINARTDPLSHSEGNEHFAFSACMPALAQNRFLRARNVAVVGRAMWGLPEAG